MDVPKNSISLLTKASYETVSVSLQGLGWYVVPPDVYSVVCVVSLTSIFSRTLLSNVLIRVVNAVINACFVSNCVWTVEVTPLK